MNLRPSGYEPDELPGCSTPRYGSSGFWPVGAAGRSWRCDAVGRSIRWIDRRPEGAAPRPGFGCLVCGAGIFSRGFRAFCRPGGDLLSRVLRRSTISAGAFHGRVRNGIGCSRSAMTTRSAKGMCSRSWIFRAEANQDSFRAKPASATARRRSSGALAEHGADRPAHA